MPAERQAIQRFRLAFLIVRRLDPICCLDAFRECRMRSATRVAQPTAPRHCEHFAANASKGGFVQIFAVGAIGSTSLRRWLRREQPQRRGKGITGIRRQLGGAERWYRRMSGGTTAEARQRTKNQELPDLPQALSERLGRRAHLPAVQVHLGMAERCTHVNTQEGDSRDKCDVKRPLDRGQWRQSATHDKSQTI